MSAISQYDKLHTQLYRDLGRNCKKDFYSASLHKGGSEAVKQGALENIGTVFYMSCLMLTYSGLHLFESSEAFARKTHNTNQVSNDVGSVWHALVSFLACTAWFHEDHPKDEVKNSKAAIACIMDDIIWIFPRDEGEGWSLPKVHGFLLMALYMTAYGNAANFYGGDGERSHITFVKDNAQNTQRVANQFVKQVGDRIKETVYLSKAEGSIMHDLCDSLQSLSVTSNMRKRLLDSDILSTNNCD